MLFERFKQGLGDYTIAANEGVSAVSDFLTFNANWKTLSDAEKSRIFKIWKLEQEIAALNEDADHVAEDADDSLWSLSSEISEFEIVERG